jgi:hypothetical protein
VLGALSLREKWLQHKADQSPLIVVENRNLWGHTFIPMYIFVEHRNKFTFTFSAVTYHSKAYSFVKAKFYKHIYLFIYLFIFIMDVSEMTNKKFKKNFQDLTFLARLD